jgi:hypothetical protein
MGVRVALVQRARGGASIGILSSGGMKLQGVGYAIMLAGAMAACGSSGKSAAGGIPAPFSSGSRLKAQYYDGGDGAVSFVGWQDTLLGVPCTFSYAEDDVWRCMPTTPFVEESFVDAQCTQPAAWNLCAGAPPPYMPIGETTACPAPAYAGPQTASAMFAIGATPLPSPTYIGGPGSCQPVDPSTIVGAVYPITHVDPSKFVAATLSLQSLSDGLAVSFLTAADGATQFLAPYDTKRSMPCGKDVHSNACLPSAPLPIVGPEPDAGCSSEVIAVDPRACVQTDLALEEVATDAGPCAPFGNDQAVVVGLGSPVAASIGNVCNGPLAPDAAQSSYYALGASVPLDDFPQLLTTSAGTGRLRAYQLSTASGDYVANAPAYLAFHDEQLGADCTPSPTGDGATRCLPSSLGTSGFSDPDCVTPVVQGLFCQTAPSVGHVTIQNENSLCDPGPVTAIYGVGPEYSGPVYQLSGGTCTMGSPASVGYWQLGAEIPLTNYAVVPLVTR